MVSTEKYPPTLPMLVKLDGPPFIRPPSHNHWRLMMAFETADMKHISIFYWVTGSPHLHLML